MKITQTLNNIPSLNSTLHCTSMCHIQLDFLQLAPHDAIPYNLAVNVTNILQYIHLFHQYSKWQDRTWYNIATHTIHAHTDTAHTLANLYARIQPNMPKYLLTYLQAHILSSPDMYKHSSNIKYGFFALFFNLHWISIAASYFTVQRLSISLSIFLAFSCVLFLSLCFLSPIFPTGSERRAFQKYSVRSCEIYILMVNIVNI